MAQEILEEEQEMFEAWWNRRHSEKTWGLTKDPKGYYIYLHADLAWQAWQAARSAQPAQPQPKEKP